ncbi:MAG TPA: HAD-IB family hydrolase [Ilumatobacteraceae bacterium]|nr:HAD-IB family hydrolase [Ilumatobacteraceae bacterium]
MTSPRAAAFFDLDRTLLRGASGEVFAGALRAAGVVGADPIPGEQFLYRLFNAIGETLPSMVLARQAVTLAKGRPQASVVAAAADVADELCALVQPFAETAFAIHRAAGRPIVLATTNPYDLVKPFADRLGLDDVVATRYGVSPDGTYDGTLDGPFVWSAGKLAAITEWADRNDVDLAESYAYSDSVYDTPMLAAVGHPVVVNPDPRMVLVAAARRWPTLNLDVSPGVLKVPVIGLEIQELAQRFALAGFYPYARFDIDGVDNIPATGPAILCGNHRSYFDVVAMSLTIAKSGRPARFLGKKEVFDAPIVGPIAAAMGGIRVDRGTGSDEPLAAAADALAGGEMVTMMPEGTIPRGPAFFRKPVGRWGAARLAQLSGAPVIPVGLWGTDRVWPRSSRVPNVLNLTSPPTVRVRVGEPVEITGRSLEADTKRIMAAVVALLPDDAYSRRKPTAQDLALTFPPGYRGDPDKEVGRRPGTDIE